MLLINAKNWPIIWRKNTRLYLRILKISRTSTANTLTCKNLWNKWWASMIINDRLWPMLTWKFLMKLLKVWSISITGSSQQVPTRQDKSPKSLVWILNADYRKLTDIISKRRILSNALNNTLIKSSPSLRICCWPFWQTALSKVVLLRSTNRMPKLWLREWWSIDF